MATKSFISEINPAAVATLPTADQLSFTERRADGGLNFWCPPAAQVGGDWGDECRLGRELGHEVLEYIKANNDAAVLGGIVRAIAKQGTFEGVEVGFFAAVSMALASPA